MDSEIELCHSVQTDVNSDLDHFVQTYMNNKLGYSIQMNTSNELDHPVQTDLSDELGQLLLRLRLDWSVIPKKLGFYVVFPYAIVYGILWFDKKDKEDKAMEISKILIWYPVVAFFIVIILLLFFRAKWNRYFKHWQENPDLNNLQIKQSKLRVSHYNITYEPPFWVWQSIASFFVNLVPYVIAAIVWGGLAYPLLLGLGFFVGIALLLLGPVTLTCDDTTTLISLAAYARRASAPEPNQ